MMEGYRLPSLTTIVCTLFLTYMSYSMWTIAQLFIAPDCPDPTLCLHPLIAQQPKLQLLVYSSIKSTPEYSHDLNLVYQVKSFDYNNDQEVIVPVPIPATVRNNGSMFVHLFLTSPKVQPKDWSGLVNNKMTVYAHTRLTQYKVQEPEAFNLLGEDSYDKVPDIVSSSSSLAGSESLPVSHFQSVVVYNVLTEAVSLPKDAMPYEVGRSLRLNSNGLYLPVLHVDELSLRMRDLLKVEHSSLTMNLTLKYYPISYGKIRMWRQFEGALHTMTNLGFTPKDLDEVKGIFSDSNLYFLCVTFIVAALHIVFDFLAFKNDIGFWRERDNMGGISSSSVAWRAFAQVVIFLYLIEENTSMLVLVPAGIGVLIEGWKVTKAFHIKLDGYHIKILGAQSWEENNTKQLDSEGFRYLSYVLYPLCIGGAAYSLIYSPHKSWYSWIVNSLVNGVYGFGFLFMLPQLFINYKLKSVAHLPWRAFMYKAFNTFIDDLFAFIITMPTSHRLACFRDDLVFIIYLYQKWLYPVDKKRVNEYGQVGEDSDKGQLEHAKKE